LFLSACIPESIPPSSKCLILRLDNCCMTAVLSFESRD
jgi:hypothetical protein